MKNTFYDVVKQGLEAREKEIDNNILICRKQHAEELRKIREMVKESESYYSKKHNSNA